MTVPWVASGTLIADNKSIEYACLGPPPSEAPTLVLLHEGLGCTNLWRDVPAALAKATDFGVLVYSRAGYGQSDPAYLPRPLDYMTHEAIQVLPEVLDATGVQCAVLLGHSDGATIVAIHAGGQCHTKILGAILIAPHFFTEPSGLAEIAKARHAFNTGDLRLRMAKYHKDPENAFRGWNDAWLDPGFESWNVAAVLETISVPVLAIQGRDDPYGTLAQIDVITHRVQQAPVYTLVLNQCRHAPHLEHSAVVLSTISAFCHPLYASFLSLRSENRA